MEHAADGVDVDPPGGDVGGHQGLDPTVGEGGQGLLPLGLAAVAVDGGHRQPGQGQLTGEPVGPPLGAAEDHGRVVARDDLSGDGRPLRPIDLPEQVPAAVFVALGVTDLVAERVPLVAADEDVDLAVEGG